MSRMLSALLTAVLLVAPSIARAQDHEHRSPYAEHAGREIKALSAEEIAGLLSGEGMGLALPAELNGFPGPRHVLELKSELGLSPGQERQVQVIFDAMAKEAREAGARIIELERQLDREFADRTINEEVLDGSLRVLALQRAHLRAVHLKAHLRLWPVLTEEQRMHYDDLRGYSARR